MQILISRNNLSLFMDDKVTISELKELVKQFCEERDWDQFHNAKELAVDMIIEAAEVLDHFRFKSAGEVDDLFADPFRRKQIHDEMADVLFALMRLAQRYNVDLSDALRVKIAETAKKYPVDKFKGSNKEYNEE